MPIALLGWIIVAAATIVFGIVLFRGMVAEWHRRDDEMRGQS